MDTDRTSRTVPLDDGRQLGYAEYGRPDGVPLMLFHGTPGSRQLSFLERAEWVERLGLRILTPERPGYGLSDPAPGHGIADWADDVAQLADRLGLDRFHVAGGSGGGPFALACALRLPGRVRSATLICSGCPPEAMHDRQGMNRGNRLVFILARYAPPLLRVLMALYARGVRKQRKPRSDEAEQKMLAHLCAWDRRVLESREDDPRAKLQLQEAFRQGPAGAYHDMLRVSHDWGLDFQSLAVPVYLWHGTADTLMPALLRARLRQDDPRLRGPLPRGRRAHAAGRPGHRFADHGPPRIVHRLGNPRSPKKERDSDPFPDSAGTGKRSKPDGGRRTRALFND